MKLEIDKKVLVVGIGNNARYSTPKHEAIITKIARKWFYVDTGDYIGEREKFSIEDYKCDGKGYSPEWIIYESEKHYLEGIEKPNLRNKVSRKLENLTYCQLEKINELIDKLND